MKNVSKPKQILMRIEADYFVAGIVWRMDHEQETWKIEKCAPILRWMTTKDLGFCIRWLKKKNFKYTLLDTAQERK